jgi:AcrR family transcriptional regulator
MASSARADILEAADHLFGRIGFDAASTREIAEASGVNKALIHYHFGNKDELFGAVLDRYYGELDTALRGALTQPGSVRGRLARVLDVYLDFLADHPSFSRIVQREAAGGRHLERIVGHMTPLFATAVTLITSAYPTTASGPLAAPQLLLSFYGMVVSSFTYGPVLERLRGASVSAGEALAHRKQHLRHMLDLIADALEASEPSTPRPRDLP